MMLPKKLNRYVYAFRTFWTALLLILASSSTINFVDFFNTSLFQESFLNSLYVAIMSVLLASVVSIPLAYFTTRFNFGGAVLIQTLGIIPLIMPPFVGAVAMLLLFGENGSANLLINDWFGFTIPFMEGLNGVILVESIHYFRSS